MLIKKCKHWELIKEESKDVTYKLLKSGATLYHYVTIKTYIKTILNRAYCMVDIGEGLYCYCKQEDYDFAVKNLKEIGIRYGKDLGFSNVFVKVSKRKYDN